MWSEGCGTETGCEGLMVEGEKDIPARKNSLSKGLELRIGCAQALLCCSFCLDDKENMGFDVGHI